MPEASAEANGTADGAESLGLHQLALAYTSSHYWIVQRSVRVCALLPSLPTPRRSSSKVWSATGLPFRPTAGMPAQRSRALPGKAGSADGASGYPAGTQISG